MEISQFNRIGVVTGGENISIDMFLNNVKFGTWKIDVEKVRAKATKPERDKLKRELLPYVTISGIFNHRNNDGLIKHSGILAIDVDKLPESRIQELWPQICADKYTFASFRSASNTGLCILVKIDGGRHLESFLGLERYYLEQYQVIIDESCKDVSRPRYVSYDPSSFVCPEKSTVFKNYLPKQEASIRIAPIISGRNDIDHLIAQIHQYKVDLTSSTYHRWLRIGFALAHEFGESGRDYYYNISQFSPKYSEKRAKDQYDHCLKSGGKQKETTIATLFHFAKEANLSILTEKTKQIIAISVQAKKGGRDIESAQQILADVVGISAAESREVVEKVFKSNIDTASDLSILDQLEFFLKSNYNLKRNEITRYVEDSSKEIDTIFVNSVWRRASKEVDERVAFESIDRLIASDFVNPYNPIKDWLEIQPRYVGPSLLEALAKCIDTDTGMSPTDPYPEYKYLFIKKWMVGMIASLYGAHSPLLLVLCGEKQNTGKTYFFRHLLPEMFWPYYAESKLDAGKDDEILMTQKWIIMDDEMGGKSKQESKKLKEMTSKDYFTLREPYGRKNVRLRRLAVLCGTSNDNHLLSDPTGNRRIIPIHVNAIDHKMFNSINKEQLLLEAYQEYRDQYKWELDRKDIEMLNKNTTDFEQVSVERELIHKYFKSPTNEGGEDIKYFTNTDIKVFIEERTKQKLSSWKLGLELKAEGFERKDKRSGGVRSKVYHLILREGIQATFSGQANNASQESGGNAESDKGIVEEHDLPF